MNRSPEPVSETLATMLASCAVSRGWAEQDEGPYHRDVQPERRDIVEDRDGAPLQLGIRLARTDNSPVADAQVEIWQCDALGRYSGFGPPDSSVVVAAGTASRGEYLPDQTFLRGASTPTTQARSRSARSTPAGTPGVPFTSTSWSTPTVAC